MCQFRGKKNAVHVLQVKKERRLLIFEERNGALEITTSFRERSTSPGVTTIITLIQTRYHWEEDPKKIQMISPDLVLVSTMST